MAAMLLGVLAPLALAYLAGSFPSALVLGRLMRGRDLRESGSGNAGATNALRVLGPAPALLVLALDVAKALAAVFLVPLAAGLAPYALLGRRDLAGLCAACAVAGHVFPVLAGFRGGKGVAVAAAAIGALHPGAVPWCLLVFGLVLSLSGYVSAASLAASLAFPVAAFLSGSSPPWEAADGSIPGLLALATPLALFLTHRSNLRRLAAGAEHRFPKAMVWRRALGALDRRKKK